MARLEFSDGQWWEYRIFMNHETLMEWVPEAMKHMTLVSAEESGDGEPSFEINFIKDQQSGIVSDDEIRKKMKKIDDLGLDLIVRQTTGWSFGAVSIVTLQREVPPEVLNQMTMAVAALVPPLDGMNASSWLNLSSLPSSSGGMSHRN